MGNCRPTNLVAYTPIGQDAFVQTPILRLDSWLQGYELLGVSVKRLALDGETGVLAFPDGGNQPGAFKLFGVMRDRRGAHRMGLEQLGTGNRGNRGGNLNQYLITPWVCEGSRDQRHLLFSQREVVCSGHG